MPNDALNVELLRARSKCSNLENAMAGVLSDQNRAPDPESVGSKLESGGKRANREKA